MKLMYSPGACSVGIHILLEEIGKPYEAVLTSLKDKANYTPDFVKINPKSKVPTLVRDDGSVLTEFPAIAYWLAKTNPGAHLLPDDVDGQTAALEAMDYVTATLHMQGFTRIARPGNFTPNAADEERVKERGAEIMTNAFALMDKALEGKEWIAGTYSVGDAALFYVEFWYAVRMKRELPPNCAAHFARMLARPAVKRVMEKEGLPH